MQFDGARLGPQERAVLDLERTWWLLHPSKELAIRERLQISPSRYYRLLHRVVDLPAALEYDPMVVRRLRRARAARRRARFESKTVIGPPR